MLLASHALAAGPLAASQPGFTILDPLSASLLGVFMFGEHIRTGGADLAGETLALAVVIVAATALSHSCHVAGETGRPSEAGGTSKAGQDSRPPERIMSGAASPRPRHPEATSQHAW